MQTTGTRQQPGYACEECRRRKARCDRVLPRCGYCVENGTQCVVIDKRPQRGPKKGQLNMMRSRIAMLEWQLGKQTAIYSDNNHNAVSPTSAILGAAASAAEIMPPLVAEIDHAPSQGDNTKLLSDRYMSRVTDLTGLGVINGPTEPELPWVPTTTTTTTTTNLDSTSLLMSPERKDHDTSSLLSPGGGTCMFSMTLGEPLDMGHTSPAMMVGDFQISDLMRADLDELYFDRAHSICPMLHQRRHFASATQESSSPARMCLRSAMRTLAAAMSAPYRGLGGVLYAETRRLLEAQTGSSPLKTPTDGNTWTSPSPHHDTIHLEIIQAWLLLAHYESLRMDERQAMLTAGRAFRLVQMARLYDIDSPKAPGPDQTQSQRGGSTGSGATASSNDAEDDGFSEIEERRRTFWVAYTLDRFLCWRNNWPLTLHEDMVSTHLPAPEVNFQNSQPITTTSLSAAMAEGFSGPLSPFAECIVLATLHGRCMAHCWAAPRATCTTNSNSANGTQEAPHGFWVRHGLIASAIERRVHALSQSPSPKGTLDRDPMLFFAHVLAHGVVVYLGDAVRKLPWHSKPDHQSMAAAYEQRAIQAGLEIVRLTKAMPSISPFKAHPFLPNPIASAANFLGAQGTSLKWDAQAGAEQLKTVLRDLGSFNSLACDYVTACDAWGW